MATDIERMIVVGTMEPVEQGQRFQTIPPHLTILRWFTLAPERMGELHAEMDELFNGASLFQNLIAEKKAMYGAENDIPVRTMGNVETAPWLALHALIRQRGSFGGDTSFVNIFSPHISDTPDHHIEHGDSVSLPTVALFSKVAGERTKRVELAYQQGDHNG